MLSLYVVFLHGAPLSNSYFMDSDVVYHRGIIIGDFISDMRAGAQQKTSISMIHNRQISTTHEPSASSQERTRYRCLQNIRYSVPEPERTKSDKSELTDCLPLIILHRAGAARIAHTHAYHQRFELFAFSILFEHFMELLLVDRMQSVLRGHPIEGHVSTKSS
jgi:hypothetical protein